MSRRDLIKTVGVTAGAAAVGSGALGDDLAPVGEADAFVVSTSTLVLVGIGFGAGVVVGAKGAEWYLSGGDDKTADETIEEWIYGEASAIATGRDEFEREFRTQFIDRPTDRTPYANAAWQEVRAAATKKIVNGGTQAEAEQAAIDALEEQTTVSIVNMVERWNTGVKALAAPVVKQISNDLSVLTPGSNGTHLLRNDSAGVTGKWSDASNLDQVNSEIKKTTAFDLPTGADTLEARDEPLELFGFFIDYQNNADQKVLAPGLGSFETSNFASETLDLTANDDNVSEILVLSAGLYDQAINAISTAYGNISSNVSTYVEQLYQGITEGAIDPSTIYSSRDIVKEFANSSEQARVAAELMAVGGNIPGDKQLGYKAEISHPGLVSDTLWVRLYPQFGSKSPKNIAPGVTLQPADYELAYVAYTNATDGSTETRVLSGEKKLEILAVEGISQEKKATDSTSYSSTAGTSGAVTVWSAQNPPEPLVDPSGYPGWVVVVTGDTNTSIHSVSETSKVGSNPPTYELSSTSLTDGENVQSVEIKPGADYQQPVQYVADPTNIDTKQQQKLLEEQAKTIEALKDALSNGPIGGGLFGGDVPAWAVWAGGGALGLIGLSALLGN